ncbi:type I polyketide synthase [Streptomyces sp. NPDC057638]|uniref:type I polyketide synthase n=1 Tax=Streptomyces sp. NPDC057638 TaxID=3346190 RepID=UPI0036CE14EF
MGNEDKLLEYLKKVTLELHDTKQRLRDVEAAGADPVAVVGMACRFPGGALSPDGLWELVDGGVDAMAGYPTDRGWELGDFTPVGGFVEGAADFDPALFGISPREALAMDPQQRLLLEVVWESLERSGIAPLSLRGLPVGVFAGTNGQDYPAALAMAGESADGFGGTGSSGSVLSGRIAYVLGLEGPAVTIDTACSSSLVALHLAAQSLRSGECTLALAGGVTVMSTPGAFVEFARQGGLASDGRCKAFSDDADGTSWGEGVGVLVLERLSDARRNGHQVLAVVRGSAVNQDGASNGLTAPNGPSQQRVIREALTNAGLSGGDVDVVEAHGTGTSLGDPIEAQALLATYGQDRDQPLWLGSIKSNIGHTQAAAGVAGLMKMILALQRESLPKTLHVGSPSSHVDWSAGAVELLTEAREWPKAPDRPRRAGVSSFGISGTNAHVIVEEAPVAAPMEPEAEATPEALSLPVVPWLVSAKSADGVAAQADRLGSVLDRDPADVGLSLAVTRSALEHRSFVVGSDAQELRSGLKALAAGESLPVAVGSGLTGVVFSGQGGQRVGMGRELASVFPVFAEVLEEVCAQFDGLLDRPLKEILFEDADGVLGLTGWAQPALFAVEVALYRLTESWGVRPDYLVGHSVGELAAAYVSGVVSLEDACRLVAARASLMQALPPGGAMWAVRASLDEVTPYLVDGVSVAAVNAPGQVVLSGTRTAVEEVAVALTDRQGRWLEVSHAFHSGLMDPMLDAFRQVASTIAYDRPRIPVVSTLTGEVIEEFSADYWTDQVRGTVRFADAITHLTGLGVTRFLEVGPDASLVGAIDETADEVLAVALLSRKRAEPVTAVTTLARLWADGGTVDWAAFYAPTTARTTDLPTYPFQHQRYWPTARLSAGPQPLGTARAGHPLLHAVVTLAGDGEVLLLGGLSAAAQPWVADHQVAGEIVFPGTGYLELALCAGDRVGCERVEELTITTPMVVPASGVVHLQVLVGAPDEDGCRSLRIASRPADEGSERWTHHASGTLAPARSEETASFGFAEWPPPGAEAVEVSALYDGLADLGLQYGPVFRGLRQAWRRGDELFVESELAQGARRADEPFALHPAVLDSVLHSLALPAEAVSAEEVGADEGRREPGRLPFSWSGVALYAVEATALRARLTVSGSESVSLQVADGSGQPVAEVDSLTLRPMDVASIAPGGAPRDSLFQVDWSPVATPEREGAFVLLGAGGTPESAQGTSHRDLAGLREALDAGNPVPANVVAVVTGAHGTLSTVETLAEGDATGATEPAGATHRAVLRTLGLIQEWLSDERLEESRLTLVTTGAQAIGAGDTVTDLAGAAVWGLVRSAQSEHPGRFQLLDLTGHDLAALTPGDRMSAVPDPADRTPTDRTPTDRTPADRTPTDRDPAEATSTGRDPAALDRAAPDRALPGLAAAADGVVLPLVSRAIASDEPQLAERDGGLLAPRIVRVSEGERRNPGAGEPVPLWDTTGTVLVTGATGELGGIVCRHLVARHGVRHLLLVSRRGSRAPGAGALAAELEGLGARVTTAACDVTDRAALTALLAAVPADRPLTGVVHTAGVVADATVTSLDAERVGRVLRPKVDATLLLDELTRDHPLTAFVLFSSVSATVGAPGQGNYSAANAFLDALAARRRASGLPALSLGWGLWEQTSTITGGLGQSDVRRIARGGVIPLSAADGTALLDLAMTASAPVTPAPAASASPASPTTSTPEPEPANQPTPTPANRAALLPVRLDLAALRGTGEYLPPLYRSLVRRPRRRAAETTSTTAAALVERFRELSLQDRRAAARELVRAQAATVLGHDTADGVAVDQPFRDLGFDSLTAVELRNHLNAATGLRLSATLVFDHPTAADVADHLLEKLLGAAPAVARAEPRPRTVGGAEDPVVIVGMACRYPGDVRNPDDLWELVATGSDGVTPFPADRGWDLERLYDADPDAGGATYVRQGGFLHEAADFDADFFGISPREALVMDPQQRLLLETSWEAIESAGIAPSDLRGQRTGVFAGVMYHDYLSRLRSVPKGAEGFLGTGSAGSVVTGRVAYLLGLEGPAVTIDTACSSSLVALHLAAQALREGECAMALAGGVTVMATPGTFIDFSKQRGLAQDGRCKSFASAADGTGWAEGVGVLLLERLSDARRNGHRVLAVVRGSAVNQDGASNGLTAPNGPAQQRVIRQALERAGLHPSEVDTVEGHGTGTVLGDPIEAQALIATYGQERPDDDPLWLGSIKSNIGHAQAAAGVGGVIKMVQAMRHGILPRTLHVDEPTAQVDWSEGAVRLLTEARDWPSADRPRRAGVSSFGISGTNAHVILEAPAPEPAPVPAPAAPETAPERTTRPLTPLLLTARTEEAVRAQAAALRAHLDRHPGTDPLDVAYSLAATRTHFDRRALVIGTDRATLLAGLDAVAAGTTAPQVVHGRSTERKVAFLFTGQGSQRVAMGRELYEEFPAFTEAFDTVCAALDRARESDPGTDAPRPLREVVFADPDGLLDGTGHAQPALFAIEVALFRLLAAHGVAPDHLVGHSVGELAAAHVAGILSLDDASRLVAARGRLMAALPPGGAMLALRATEEEIAPVLPDGVDIAAVNGPDALVLSGEEAPLLALAERFADRASKRLRVSHAFHSARMEPMLAEFREIAESVTYHPARIPVVPTAGPSGTPDAERMRHAEYWVRQVRESVRFHDAVTRLTEAGVTSFVELGPDPVLTTALREAGSLLTGAGRPPLTAATLRRGRPETTTFAAALGTLLAQGTRVDWEGFYADSGARRVDLPTYAFQRRRYWADATEGPADLAAAGLGPAGHPLLGACLPLPDGGFVCTGRFSSGAHPWLADHTVAGTAVVPGTALLDLAVHAGDHVGHGRVGELVLAAPLPLDSARERRVQLVTGPPDDSGDRTVRLLSRLADAPADAPWTTHASGTLTTGAPESANPPHTTATTLWPPPDALLVPLDDLYAPPSAVAPDGDTAPDEETAPQGVAYGPAFQGLRAAWRRDGELFAEVTLPDPLHEDAPRYGIHPALLDAALHGVARLLPDAAGRLVPFAWNGVELHAEGATTLRVHLTALSPERLAISAADPSGHPVATVDSLTLRPLATGPAPSGTDTPPALDDLFQVEWTPLPAGQDPPEDAAARRLVLVGSDSLAIAEPLAAAGVPVESFADLPALAAAVATGMTLPETVLVTFDGTAALPAEALPHTVRTVTAAALETVRQWLADNRFAEAHLVCVTRSAVAGGDGGGGGGVDGVTDLACAPLWGLLRTAQSENPGRFVLADLDGSPESVLALPTALASGEPQLAVRSGLAYAARLARVTTPAAPVAVNAWNPDGTVLLTGATGALGGLVARHLVTARGVRALLLLSRSGADSPAGAALRDDLTALGAEVTLAACDTSDRDALAAALATIPAERPLTAVLHLAGVLDDGVVTALTPERFDTVYRAKVDAAFHLHELTQGHDLADFVLFSSSAAVFGTPGQANYAAANAFLDALAERRRADGLPATSLAWGAWEGGMAARLDGADRGRMARGGVLALTEREGLDLFEAALGTGLASLVPLRLDTAALTPGTSPLLRALVRPTARRAVAAAAAGPTLAHTLASLDEEGRRTALLRLVREVTATVLGHPGTDGVEPERPFLELGLDSLTAVELRNALAGATGLKLPATVTFDHPTPLALAAQLHTELAPQTGPEPEAGVPGAAGDTVGTLFRRAFEDRKLREGFELLNAVAALRPSFADPAEVTQSPTSVRLARGPEPVRLICFSSQVALAGVHQYARFASALRDIRDVTALAVPGFATGEPLPATEEALVGLLARMVREQSGGAPVALLGSSSGGVLAYATAARLERDGDGPAGVVLLDTYVPGDDSLDQFEDQLLGGMFAREASFARMDAARLSAMSWYFNLLGGWRPEPLTAPRLLVRAGEPMAGGQDLAPERWQTQWSAADTTVDVSGNHFTMMEDLAGETARTVDTWLRGLAG